MHWDEKNLHNTVTGFLKQRASAYKVLRDNTRRAQTEQLLNQWRMIRSWGHWRQCREIQMKKDAYEQILPSINGKHWMIRVKMQDVFNNCCRIADTKKAYATA